MGLLFGTTIGKIIITFLVSMTILLTLTACAGGELPAGMDADALVASGREVLLLLVEIILLIATRRNAAIHDLLAGTVVADYTSQMIFDSSEALLAYQKRIHAEQAARQDY